MKHKYPYTITQEEEHEASDGYTLSPYQTYVRKFTEQAQAKGYDERQTVARHTVPWR